MDISEREFQDLDEVRDFLDEEADGVATFKMWQLRDALGYSKLGPNVVSELSEELDSRGVGHVPAELGINRHDEARLYLRSTPIGRLLDLALKPGYGGDVRLRESLSDASHDKLEKIRRILR